MRCLYSLTTPIRRLTKKLGEKVSKSRVTKLRRLELLCSSLSAVMEQSCPLIILKNRKIGLPNNPFTLQNLLFQNHCGWIDNVILSCWLDKVIFNMNFLSTNHLPYLILDRCPAHTHKNMKEILLKSQLRHRYIPSGCTGLIQPVDTHIGKPFKDRLRDMHKRWFDELGSIKNTTKAQTSKTHRLN